mmetsp:Transcript_24885/g.49532  ORF Transcript_24885/g.49532 Transcript_24885/m.49532 type:complete len:245 (-) Transcript_24885:723-1457(-)
MSAKDSLHSPPDRWTVAPSSSLALLVESARRCSVCLRFFSSSLILSLTSSALCSPSDLPSSICLSMPLTVICCVFSSSLNCLLTSSTAPALPSTFSTNFIISASTSRAACLSFSSSFVLTAATSVPRPLSLKARSTSPGMSLVRSCWLALASTFTAESRWALIRASSFSSTSTMAPLTTDFTRSSLGCSLVRAFSTSSGFMDAMSSCFPPMRRAATCLRSASSSLSRWVWMGAMAAATELVAVR